jgi:hypothetical protein
MVYEFETQTRKSAGAAVPHLLLPAAVNFKFEVQTRSPSNPPL